MRAPTLVLVPGLWHGGSCWARVMCAFGAPGEAGVASRPATLVDGLDLAQGNEVECLEKPTEQKFDNAWWALLYSEHYGSNSPQVE